MSELRNEYLAALGIPVWVQRGGEPDATDPGASSMPSLDDLAAQVRACTRCALHASRKQTVFGVGNPSADLLIIGEAPGADEDRQGEPFVGRAGQLLNAMLAAVHLARGDVSILAFRHMHVSDERIETGYFEYRIIRGYRVAALDIPV